MDSIHLEWSEIYILRYAHPRTSLGYNSTKFYQNPPRFGAVIHVQSDQDTSHTTLEKMRLENKLRHRDV